MRVRLSSSGRSADRGPRCVSAPSADPSPRPRRRLPHLPTWSLHGQRAGCPSSPPPGGARTRPFLKRTACRPEPLTASTQAICRKHLHQQHHSLLLQLQSSLESDEISAAHHWDTTPPHLPHRSGTPHNPQPRPLHIIAIWQTELSIRSSSSSLKHSFYPRAIRPLNLPPT
ncbi:hypothetical protein MHYP_G00196450 [Metynnis hypsauchen]